MEPQSFDERIERIEMDLKEIKVLLDTVHTYMVKTDHFITEVSDQVAPLIDDIKTGGIMKLLGGFGKKR